MRNAHPWQPSRRDKSLNQRQAGKLIGAIHLIHKSDQISEE